MTAQRGDFERSTAPQPSPDRPTCLEWTAHGHCIRDEGHEGVHMPLPRRYPPRRLPKTDGGPSLPEFLRSKGEIA